MHLDKVCLLRRISMMGGDVGEAITFPNSSRVQHL